MSLEIFNNYRSPDMRFCNYKNNFLFLIKVLIEMLVNLTSMWFYVADTFAN